MAFYGYLFSSLSRSIRKSKRFFFGPSFGQCPLIGRTFRQIRVATVFITELVNFQVYLKMFLLQMATLEVTESFKKSTRRKRRRYANIFYWHFPITSSKIFICIPESHNKKQFFLKTRLSTCNIVFFCFGISMHIFCEAKLQYLI